MQCSPGMASMPSPGAGAKEFVKNAQIPSGNFPVLPAKILDKERIGFYNRCMLVCLGKFQFDNKLSQADKHVIINRDMYPCHPTVRRNCS